MYGGFNDSAIEISSLSELDSNAKLLSSSIVHKLMPLIQSIDHEKKERKKFMDENPKTVNEIFKEQIEQIELKQKEELLNCFNTVSGHLDVLYNSILPDFSMNIVVPTDNTRENGIPIPVVLSTLVQENEKDYQVTPNPLYNEVVDKFSSSSSSGLPSTETLNNISFDYSKKLENIIDKFNLGINEWKKNVKDGKINREKALRKYKFK